MSLRETFGPWKYSYAFQGCLHLKSDLWVTFGNVLPAHLKLVILRLVLLHIQGNCHCSQLYDGNSSWWPRGYYTFLHVYYVCSMSFFLIVDCRCILVGKRGISFLSLDLFKLCVTSIYAESGIYHFKWYDLIHSWKRCREPLLYFVIYIVTEYTGSSQKKRAFLVSQNFVKIAYFCCIRIS